MSQIVPPKLLVHLFLPGVCASFPHTTSISWTLGKEMNLECPLPNLHSQGGVESNGSPKEPPKQIRKVDQFVHCFSPNTKADVFFALCSGRLCVEQKDINMKPLQLRRNPLNGSLKKKTPSGPGLPGSSAVPVATS